MKGLLTMVYIMVLVVSSCSNADTSTDVVPEEKTLQDKLAALSATAITGDLVVRLGDDLISERIKYLNEKDYAYSHAGIIIEVNGEKQVFHISPDGNHNDTIQVVSIDSFLNPVHNLSCGLYRYNLLTEQRAEVSKIVESYKRGGVRFDRRYSMETDQLMYCSEMIAKAITRASDSMVHFRQVHVPKRMQVMVAGFLKAEKISPQLVADTKILTLDNLYSMPECTLLAKFTLKQLPGQQ
ncbi:hypothetical protein EXU57_12985 [Segetibacter sp. 3557_3]|uniref:YiiX/YebB-like N1pC/P60 family cysteine hydrolase n=1 Tax=Segetibacter sp. 3557_3 TaxID=2547429 RepID=UPI0010586644|nr:YiiX/YebB-like N1pC/P60 family cysteine hydrolase [Segetibacter sp. 3557_3]TDH25613.1 hypothetical protein EXU57_12985 [Segetibacter sp. 3557_3]